MFPACNNLGRSNTLFLQKMRSVFIDFFWRWNILNSSYATHFNELILVISQLPKKTFLCNNIHVEISLRIICIFEGSYVLIMLTLLELTFLLCKKRCLLLFLCINHNHIFMSFLATNVLGFIHSYCQIFLIIYSMNRSERHAKKNRLISYKNQKTVWFLLIILNW